MSLHPAQFRDLIRRVLTKTRPRFTHDLDNAVELLMLTAAAESELGTYLRQTNGPALGVFQMEPRTYKYLLDYLHENKKTKAGMRLCWASNFFDHLDPGPEDSMGFPQLEWNLAYAIVMARINYMRFPEPLPDKTDVRAMAEYWKKYWNTTKGKGTVIEAVRKYDKYVKERE